MNLNKIIQEFNKKKFMKILSIYPFTHISSASLIIDGKIVSAAPEERFNRIKMSTDFPIQAINWCLNYAKIGWKDLDYVVVPWNPVIIHIFYKKMGIFYEMEG